MNFKKISSVQNDRIKELLKLRSAKNRRLAGRFIVENLAIISDSFADGYFFEALFVTEEFAAKNQELLEKLATGASRAEFFLITEKINQAYSELSTPSGITGVYKINNHRLADGRVVYLDGISDPGNLGTIMRSALAFGWENLVLSQDCVDPYNAKTVSAAKDAIFKIRLLEDREGGWLKKTSLPLYATDVRTGTELKKFKPAEKFCLVLGSESHGVSPEIMKRAAQKINIATFDKIESLNVAAAAAIIFYELGSK